MVLMYGTMDVAIDTTRTLIAQLNRVLADPGLPAAAVAPITVFRANLEDVERGISQLGNPLFTQEAFVRATLLNVYSTYEGLSRLEGVYTHYWRVGLAHAMVFLLNTTLYEGPQAIIRPLEGLSHDDYLAQHLTAAYTECFLDHTLSALIQGRVEGWNRFDCTVIGLFNTYFDANINPLAFGCPFPAITPNLSDLCSPCVLRVSTPVTDDTCDGQDSDCDGWIDDDWVGAPCNTGQCVASEVCIHSVRVGCTQERPLTPVDLTCDGVDDDCDGAIDNGSWGGVSCEP